ncbi:hypothetical protein SAMN04489713_122128 [Actinomadura madurae]|uniref:Uncharacterized protein n=2 Tax=Actinomadura madurae TaxID=1993 RepID=A0A1I5W005_9ACTN|nr:hypothetical protein SAMN04489713_122128 [Actinomadura madurae]
MPWFTDPVDFLADVDEIRRESQSLDDLTDSEDLARLFRQARGSAGPDPVELPWLDVDLAVLIAVCRYAGDDTVAATFSAFTGALGLAGPRRYGYVGPAEILQQVQAGRHGEAITSHHDLAIWLAQQAAQDREEPFTFVIDLTGTLRLAPQRSEHVICAGGEAVLSAGEITLTQDRDRWVVSEISNQSTGYCPDVSSWQAVAAALGRAGLDHPTAFSHPITFRRCPQCHQRNIVKDDHYVCAVCETPLPDYWNMDEPARDTEA